MPSDKTKRVTPKLRFPEFQGKPLRRVRLGDVTESCTARNGKQGSGLPIMGVSKTDGIVPMEDRLIGKDVARYKRLEKDAFAYNPMRLNIGSIARWTGDGDVLVSPDYIVFRCPTEGTLTIDPAYLDHFRSSGQWQNFVTESGDGGVRIRIYYKDLARLTLTLPEPAEQRKIADCLSSLDAAVAAQGRKLEALRAHKRGLMQALFPREGQTRPRLRFPQFRNAGEWEATDLDEVVSFRSGGTPSKSNAAYWNGTIPWASAKDMKDVSLEDTEDHITEQAVADGARKVPAGTILILVRGMTLLKDVPICIVRRPMSFNQDVKALRVKGGLETEFLAYLLLASKRRLMGLVDTAGHGTGRLNTDKLRGLALALPQPAEQQHIAACLSSLDALIAAASAKLAALQTHKKGLTQQLFPPSEGA